MSALDELLQVTSEHLVEGTENARAELAQLRANIEEWHNEADRRAHVGIRDRSALQSAQERIAEMARQLEAAREIIGIAKNDYQEDVQNGIDSYDKGQCCIDWLAANPAPEVQQASDNNDDWIDSYAKAALRLDRPQP